jgi:tripeptidyl-peptidase I
MFAQLGARGVSVLFSSGDSGVGSACLSNDGRNKTEFQPQFPASCPWVTSVGATRYINPEVATYFSSGGFSRLWQRPSYQERAVSEYLGKIGNRFSQYYNRNGRGFPDVAAQGYGFAVYDMGTLKHYQGTSCSSPTFAAIVALLNSARISSHLPPLGFLNPWIYFFAYRGLNDITHGGSTGCDGLSRFRGAPNGSPVIPFASFNATEGWDPVTGYGTPDFGKLLQYSTPWVKNAGGAIPAK